MVPYSDLCSPWFSFDSWSRGGNGSSVCDVGSCLSLFSSVVSCSVVDFDSWALIDGVPEVKGRWNDAIASEKKATLPSVLEFWLRCLRCRELRRLGWLLLLFPFFLGDFACLPLRVGVNGLLPFRDCLDEPLARWSSRMNPFSSRP